MRRIAAIAVVAIWLSLAFRLGFDIADSVAAGTGVLYGLAKFITAFTTLANILIAGSLTASLTDSKASLARFLTSPALMGCAATYITVMAIVFALFLAPEATSAGLNRVEGGFLHGANPLLYLAYWFILAPKQQLKPVHAFIWPLGAIVYFLVVLIRGSLSGTYPYAFVDAGLIGFPRVFFNAGALLVLFVIIGLIIVAIDRRSPWGGMPANWSRNLRQGPV